MSQNQLIKYNDDFMPINKDLVGLYDFNEIEFYVKQSSLKDDSRDVSLEQLPKENTLFLRKKDYPKFLKQLLHANRPTQNNSSNLKNLNFSMEALFNSFKEFGISAENAILLKEVSSEISSMDTKAGFKELISLIVQGKKIHESLFRSFFTRLIAQHLGWTSNSNIQKVVTAAFFSPLSSIFDNASEDVRNIVSEEVIQIAKHSAENQDGTGPLKVKKAHIHPMAKLIRVAAEFYPYFAKKQIVEGTSMLKQLSPLKLDSASVSAAIKIFQNKF